MVTVIVDLIAGHFLSRKIPNMDYIFDTITRRFDTKLNRKERSESALKMRGLITLSLCLSPLFFIGHLANVFGTFSAAGTAVALLVLLPFLSQKAGWLHHREQMYKSTSSSGTPDQNSRSQKTTQAIILNFSVRFLPTSIFFLLGGFMLLLPYRFLVAFVEYGQQKRSGAQIFFKYGRALHEIIMIPTSLIAALLLGLAHFFIPGTNLHLFQGLKRNTTSTLASSFLPLNVVADGLQISLLRGQANTAKDKWIGPESGRAKLTPSDLRSVWFVVLVAYSLSLICLTMLAAVFFVSYANDLPTS